MGRLGDRIGLGICQRHWLGHCNRRGCWNEFNSDDHDHQIKHCRWLGPSHSDVSGCGVDSNVWGHDINGYWFYCADRQLRLELLMGWYGNGIRLGSGQRHWLGHDNRRGCWDEFNSHDHDHQIKHCRWLGTSHGDLASCCVDSNVWGHNTNGYGFYGPNQ